MKDFIKFTFATITGIILTGGILFLFSLIVLFGIIASSEQEVKVKKNSIFTLKLSGTLQERAIENPFALFMGDDYDSMGLNDILRSIKKAKENDNIRGIYLEAGQLAATEPASLEEIRKALVDFKQSGKFIISYGDNYSQGEYYLCSVADKVILNPQGTINWVGLASQPIFYKGLLDKLGINMQIFKVGTYKSAVEPFIAKEMSEANREQVNAYLQSIWTRITTDVATSRNLTPEQLNNYADMLLAVGPAEDLVAHGLVDTLLYMDGAKSYLKQLLDMEEDQSINTLNLSEMNSVQQHIPLDKSGNIIAVFYATGEITDNATSMSSSTEEIVGEETIKELNRLREDDNVKAVVLRVNSPGGSAFASEQIWNEVIKLKDKKPVIVSMGGTAASGGYYISCAADTIYAEPTTLTGSIGIFGMIPDMQELLHNKIGLDFDIVKTNRYTDLGTIVRPMNDNEKQFIQKSVDRGYNLFVKRCADGRGMTLEAIQQVAEGRVWTGAMAVELGLVDKLGGLDEALLSAASKAGIEDYTVLSYPKQPSFLDNLIDNGRNGYINGLMKAQAGEYYPFIHLTNRLQQANRLQAHMEFLPNIKM